MFSPPCLQYFIYQYNITMTKTLKTEYRKLSDLKKLPNNPRTITREDMQKLKASIKKFWVLEARPLILSDRTGELVIIGGNMRYEACIELGIEEVPTHLIEWLSEEDEREIIIRDNVNNGEWDMEALANEWSDDPLAEWGVDISFSVEEPTAEEDDFDATPPEIPFTVPWDLYEIGEHRLLCGDSTNVDDAKKMMNWEMAKIVFTDPPYNVSIGTIKHPKFKQREIKNDSMSSEDFKTFCSDWAEIIRMCTDGIIYCWAWQWEDGRVMFTVLDEKFHNSTTIIWVKDQFTLWRWKYQNQYEPCWFGWVKDGTGFTDDRTLVNVWNFDRPKKSELHPTMKPIALIENWLKHSTNQGDIVLDLFLWSGSTMVASHQLNRKCYGMELDPKYCDVIVNRMIALDPSLVIKRNWQPFTIQELQS